MKRKQPKKLHLERERIRIIDASQLKLVVAGVGDTTTSHGCVDD